jgi:hypothetical protein
MTSSTTRTLNWFEKGPDFNQISKDNWQFQIAHEVLKGNNAKASNVVWQSSAICGIYTLSWDVDYALNWAYNYPTGSNIKVTAGGFWQKCNPGQVFNLNTGGQWKEDTDAEAALSPDDQSWLNIGQINFTPQNANGVYLVVGVKTGTTYKPIFIDDTLLPKGSHAKYQPQENMTWWLAQEDLTGSVYSSVGTMSTSMNFANQNDDFKREWSTTYKWNDKWYIYQNSPPQAFLAAPPSTDPVIEPPILATMNGPLTISRGTSFDAGVPDKLLAWLQNLWKNIHFSVTLSADSLSITVKYSSTDKSGQILGFVIQTDTPPSESDLQGACKDELEKDWSITDEIFG